MDDQKIIELFFKRCEEAITAVSEKYGKMSLSTNYVNVHLHRTRERLKQYLVKENWHEERIG